MLARLTQRLSYANVIATVALFLALGGGAYAAFHLPKNSVGSKNIKKHAVKAKHLAKGAVKTAAVKKKAITGGKVKPDTLTGKQIKESSLGKVPKATNSDKVGGSIVKQISYRVALRQSRADAVLARGPDGHGQLPER